MAKGDKPRGASSTAGASSTEKDPHESVFKNAAKMVSQLTLTSVRFVNFSSQAGANPDDFSDDTEIRFSTAFLRPTHGLKGEELKGTTTFFFSIAAKTESGDQKIATARATLELAYQIRSDVTELVPQEITDFLLCYLPFHAWGYWREYVQSSLARLGLPPTTVPLFRLPMAPLLVIERSDSGGANSQDVQVPNEARAV